MLLCADENVPGLCINADSVAGVVLFRLPMSTPESVAKLMADILESREDWEGHFSVVEEASVRMRPLPTS